jgi:hypothetical protein
MHFDSEGSDVFVLCVFVATASYFARGAPRFVKWSPLGCSSAQQQPPQLFFWPRRPVASIHWTCEVEFRGNDYPGW